MRVGPARTLSHGRPSAPPCPSLLEELSAPMSSCVCSTLFFASSSRPSLQTRTTDPRHLFCSHLWSQQLPSPILQGLLFPCPVHSWIMLLTLAMEVRWLACPEHPLLDDPQAPPLCCPPSTCSHTSNVVLSHPCQSLLPDPAKLSIQKGPSFSTSHSLRRISS